MTEGACITTTPGVLCAVRVADCMPVLIATPKGIAAIHAGWRGLAQGILTRTLKKLLTKTNEEANQANVWLGPCIGPQNFEVGSDVKDAFQNIHIENLQAFTPHPLQTNKWFADLPWLAMQELQRTGVQKISMDARCTFTEEKLFFSYRRDQKKLGGTGRMLCGIWIQNNFLNKN